MADAQGVIQQLGLQIGQLNVDKSILAQDLAEARQRIAELEAEVAQLRTPMEGVSGAKTEEPATGGVCHLKDGLLAGDPQKTGEQLAKSVAAELDKAQRRAARAR